MNTVGSIILLLVVAALAHQRAKKVKIPYAILLFLLGALLGLGLDYFGGGMTLGVTFSPELLFFVFLPVLIFESGYMIKYQQLAKDYVVIWTLAIGGVLLSTALIGGTTWRLLNAIGYPIPLIVTLLFGVIISATDPVAVLAIFKHIGVPKRLRLIFEGESLFNDGTALALFLVLIQLANNATWGTGTLLQGLGSFAVMVIGGIILGTLCGVIFSYLIKQIKNNELAEITLVMILAHGTFLLAEFISERTLHTGFHIQLSGVIATAYAALIMGNFGKTKITPRVEIYMDKFWSFFAFVCNALVFLLMGIMIHEITIPLVSIRPLLLVCIVVVVIARAISIYLPLGVVNRLKACKKIPLQWQHLLARGSLRGSVSLVMVLLIPADFLPAGWVLHYSPQELLLVMVITLIIFSLVVKGLTIKGLTQSMGINKLQYFEEFEKYESEVLVYTKILEKIENMMEHYEVSEESYEQLTQKYQNKIIESRLKMEVFLTNYDEADILIEKALKLHALGIERQYLKEMFHYNEIPENLYHYMEGKIAQQSSRVRKGKKQIRGFDKPIEQKRKTRDPVKRLLGILEYTSHDDHDDYILNRTRMIVTSKVLESLEIFQNIDFGYDKKQINPIIALYTKFNQRALQQHQAILSQEHIESILLNKGLAKTEEHVIADLLAKDMITEKLYQKFTQEIEDEIHREY